MPEPVLEIHPEVESDDLVDIASYIAKDNPDAAMLLLVEIEQTFQFVAPEVGTLYHPARKSLSDIRMMPVVAYPIISSFIRRFKMAKELEFCTSCTLRETLRPSSERIHANDHA
jgi:hypothetical protein